ncbi:MAG: hypothetical protein HYT87_12700 [Nitrospirae bacterium]|nr:hypothetical protein [Nitrospirota bacterium]
MPAPFARPARGILYILALTVATLSSYSCLEEDPSEPTVVSSEGAVVTDSTPPLTQITKTSLANGLQFLLHAEDPDSGLREIVWCSDVTASIETATCHTPIREALNGLPPRRTTQISLGQIQAAARRATAPCDAKTPLTFHSSSPERSAGGNNCATWLAFYAVNDAGLKSVLTWMQAASHSDASVAAQTSNAEPFPAPAAQTITNSDPDAPARDTLPPATESAPKPIITLSPAYLVSLNHPITIKASAPQGQMLHRLEYCFVTTSTQTCGPSDWTQMTTVSETLFLQALPPQAFSETRTYELLARAATVDDVLSDIVRAKVTVDASGPGLLLTGPFGEAVSGRSSVPILISASDQVGVSRISYCVWPNAEVYDWSADHPFYCIPDDYSISNDSGQASFEMSITLGVPQGKALSMGLCVQACDTLGNCSTDCGGFYSDTEPTRCVVRNPGRSFHKRWSGSSWEKRPPFEDGQILLDCDLKDGLYTGPLPANFVRTPSPETNDLSRLSYCVTPTGPQASCTPNTEAERCYRSRGDISPTECAPRSFTKPVPFYRIPEDLFCHGSSCARFLFYEAADYAGIKTSVKSIAVVVDETPPQLLLSGDPRYTGNLISGVPLPALQDDRGIDLYRWCLKIESLQPGRQGVTVWQDGLPSTYCPRDLSRTPADTWRNTLEDAWGYYGHWSMGPIGYPMIPSCPSAPCRALLSVEAVDTSGNFLTVRRLVLTDNLSGSGSQDTSTPEVRMALFSANGIPSFSAGTLKLGLDVVAFDHVSDVDRATVYLERASTPPAGKCGTSENRIPLGEFALSPADPSNCGATYGCHAGSGSFSPLWTSLYPVSSLSSSTPYTPCEGQDILYQGKGIAICVQNAPECDMKNISQLPSSLREWIDLLHVCDSSKTASVPLPDSPRPPDPSGAWRILVSVRDRGGNWSNPDTSLSGACPHTKEFTIQ